MCEFCKNIKKYEKHEDYLMGDGILFDEQDGRHWIITKFRDFEDGIAVKFCPMCGRDLTEEE